LFLTSIARVAFDLLFTFSFLKENICGTAPSSAEYVPL
jgi:hypothetical protein